MSATFITENPYGDYDIHEGIWYHTFEFHRQHPDILPEYDLRPCLKEFLLPADMKGKSFLDIGTANGFFSFTMEQRGAAVTSYDLGVDDVPDQIPYPGSPDRAEGNRNFIRGFHKAYWYAHRHFKSKARVAYGSVMKMPDWLGQYDVTLLGSILQHLRDPMGALIEADKHTRHTLIVCEAYYKSREPVMRFQANPEAAKPQYWTWWLMSPAFLVTALKSLGYRDIEVNGPFDLNQQPGRYKVPTVTVKGSKS
jgi:SAM-dependent methyltransferase